MSPREETLLRVTQIGSELAPCSVKKLSTAISKSPSLRISVMCQDDSLCIIT